MSNLIPPGFIHQDHGIFESVGKGGIVTMGCIADWPDLSSYDDDARTDVVKKLRIMLTSVQPGEQMQFTCTTSSTEFTAPLARFHEQTASFRRAPDLCIRTRTELVNRYRREMADQKLIQSSARIYLSARMEGMTRDNGRVVRGFDDTFEVFRRSFEHRRQSFDSLIKPFGGSIEPLDNAGLYRDLVSFWSPGQAKHAMPDHIDWLRPVEDLCRFSDLAPRNEPEHGFYMDGHYFGVVVAKKMPRSTAATCMEPLLNLTVPGLRIVLNVEPLSVEKEIQAQDEIYDKLVSNADPNGTKASIITGLDLPLERQKSLQKGDILPYRAQLLVVVHDRSRDALDERIEAVRAALGKVGCEAFVPSLPTATVAFFNRATPGYGPWSRYQDYNLKVSDAVNAADLVPAGSTPKGDLDGADCIFDGDSNNLMGMRMFLGSQPVHFPVIGPNGGGKSALVLSMMAQVAPKYSLIAVIDNKRGYEQMCVELDPHCKPFVIRTGGGMTFNPFHFRGPLSPGAVSDASALVHLIVGKVSDEDKDKLRAAVISGAIQRLYDDFYNRWWKQNTEEHLNVCRAASTLLSLCDKDNFNMPGATAREAYQEALYRNYGSDLEALLEPEECTDESDTSALALSRDPKTADFVRDLAFTIFEPWQFPTLSDLQDELYTTGVQGGAHKELYLTLAKLLQSWLRDGRYGAILDGPNNVDLGSTDVDAKTPLKILVFELSEIKESEKELRDVMGFLLSNQIMNLVQGMPRNLRKMIIVEELGGFLKIPKGAQIIIDNHERARAYQAQVITVFQQWGSLLETAPAVARAIMGNSLAMLLLKNKADDLEAIGRSLYLPDVVKQKIQSFQQPEDLRDTDDPYAGFVWVTMHGKEPRFTAGKNRLNPELARMVSSSGDVFEEKRKEQKNAIKIKAA